MIPRPPLEPRRLARESRSTDSDHAQTAHIGVQAPVAGVRGGPPTARCEPIRNRVYHSNKSADLAQASWDRITKGTIVQRRGMVRLGRSGPAMGWVCARLSPYHRSGVHRSVGAREEDVRSPAECVSS